MAFIGYSLTNFLPPFSTQNRRNRAREFAKKLIALVEPQSIPEPTRENVLAKVNEDVQNAWKLSKTTEELNLIVLDVLTK